MITTKIIATVGPACWDSSTLAAMITEGVDLLRLNFSHGKLDEHAEAVSRIRQICHQTGATVAIIGDLCGPKIRLGRLAGGRCQLQSGQRLAIQRRPVLGTPARLSTNYPSLVDEVKPPARILIDDGQIELRVLEARPDELICQVEVGGELGDNKGLNLPDSVISAPSLTEKDRHDLDWAIRQDLDFIALSFVRSADDLRALRAILKQHGSGMKVIAKIEKPQAIAHIEPIVAEADAVLVARGDLGVEMDPASVPLLQKEIVLRCRQAGKPAIIATQMLQSMTTAARPTRAEVSDVANAILDSADAVMLSAETSVGQHPVEAVRAINRIAAETEAFLARTAGHDSQPVTSATMRVTSAVVHGANLIARDLAARLVAIWTETGYTVGLLSKHRLPQPIVGLSPHPRVCRQMELCYGVEPVCMTRPPDQQEMLAQLDQALLARRLVQPNDLILVAAGTALHWPGATNALLIHLVGQPSGQA
ncbi:MAG: pyruvate kinase [Phycisphaerae bacterium]